jgi:glycerate kinase
MKIVIAPDSFKECLPASRVAAALAKGALEAYPSAQIDLCPMADGGEGTVDAMVAATGGRLLTVDVFDPLGSLIRARLGLLGPGAAGGVLPGEVGLSGALAATESDDQPVSHTAVIEMAAASGLALVRPEHRDPTRTTTFGTGQLLLAALDAGAREIIIGVGGSATTDGGCGAAQALGVSFLDRDGELMRCGISGGMLEEIGRIDASDIDERLAGARLRVACDVNNPLTGPSGAAAVYSPQKGATPEMAQRLDAGLKHLAAVIRRDLGVEIETMPGAGAAGGLAAGLVAFAGAQLESGIDAVAKAVGLERRLADADLCITGEGTLDGQSSAGKTAFGVAQVARRRDVPVICVAGQVADDAPRDAFNDVLSLVGDEVSQPQAIQHAETLLQRRIAEALSKGR